MVSREAYELLTRVGSGTPMGELIRRFWVPACLSEELPEPDCDPIRLRLLGEDYVAFRDSDGRVGVMDEHCPHRGASLFLGRNEEGGLRCLYHGWKMDVHGNVLETPCEPAESRIRFHVKHAAYPVVEQGDVVWTYLGPPDKQPPFPNFWWTTVPPENRCVGKIDYACNYLQAIEGAIDSSHADVLHSGYELLGWGEGEIRQVEPGRTAARETRWEAEESAYGFRYAAVRGSRANPGTHKSVRVTEFAVPFHCLLSDVPHMFVPADDESTWFYDVRTQSKPVDRQETLTRRGERVGVDVGPNRRKTRTVANNWMQDRAAMRAKKEVWSYSGIAWGKPHQDMAVIESMGPVYDRTKEHLGIQDVGIVRMRQRMLSTVRRFIETREVAELDPSVPYDRIRGYVYELPADMPWQLAVYGELRDGY
ncbi:MAG: Rieske 2Fe-2S domain-containing protein [Chloroflexi bacterium]|nr:Rieske 2Fe-2S domain-containing protein [Chloroflexota bacterium]